MSPEQLHKTLLDSLSTALIVTDGNLRLRYMNPAAEALLGVGQQRCQGEPLTEFFYQSDDTESQLRLAATQAHHYTQRQAQWQLPGGKPITVDYTVTPFGDQSELIIEIQPVDRLLRISRNQWLSTSQSTTRNLVRGMAHEIKNPLGGIRGAAQLLAKELPQPELQEYTRVIIDEADRLRNLADRLLGPTQQPQHQPVNIHEALERVATIIKAESDAAIHLVRDYDPSIPPLRGDQEHLIQALLNIARNALQALLESGTEAPQILLRTRIGRRYTIGQVHHPLIAVVDIIDNGPGIPKEVADNIFYPLISGRAEGTGLGLTIAQQLIHQHQGFIECHSVPGTTRFSLHLPLEPANAKVKSHLDH